jgi:alkanesulfonate monooxygenase SsuD/methylene tetrahydromethanopterin reductase-like flavin-dependent oxidoreductase (luciferase family)
LARETSRIRLGTLVSPVTFRNPGALAITVAQVDQMSGGRVELGLGAGWNEAEHRACSLDFPDPVRRFDLLEEQLELITGLWATPEGDRFGYSGRHYTIVDSPALPKPAQTPHPPVIIGGSGARRTPALAAEHAAEFNAAFKPVSETAEQFARVRSACAAAGRDPATLALSVAHATVVGMDDADVRRRLEVYGAEAEEIQAHALVGTPAEVVDRLGRFAAAGADRAYLQILDLADLDHLDLIASEVLPHMT